MTARQRQLWTPQEIALLRDHYADTLTSDLAAQLGRPMKYVLAKANALGLRKSLTLIAETARQRTMVPGHGSHATRLKPGNVPANKGLKRPGWAPGRMAETQFKAGNKPHTWVPVGSFRITDGVLEQKYADDPGPPGRRWKSYARIVWERVHGPVPAGMSVVFKPGARTTDPELITAEVLELLSRAELMARNTRHRYGEEINQLIALRCALARQINRRSKDKP